MPKVTFTQFCNELAQILGTHQHAKSSALSITVSSVGAEPGEEGLLSKSQQKHENKISAQSSRIRTYRVNWTLLSWRIPKCGNFLIPLC